MAQPRDKKRSDTAGISDVTGNFQLKPGSICRVFRKDLFVEPFVEKSGAGAARATHARRMTGSTISIAIATRSNASCVWSMDATPHMDAVLAPVLSATAGLFVYADGSE
jgi:hypothetical protein